MGFTYTLYIVDSMSSTPGLEAANTNKLYWLFNP